MGAKPLSDFAKGEFMARCNIYYNQYNIIANEYIPHIKVVETEDVYHEIGMIICRSIERIKNLPIHSFVR